MKTYYYMESHGNVYEHVYVVDRAHKQMTLYYIESCFSRLRKYPENSTYPKHLYNMILVDITKPPYTKWTKNEFEQWLFIYGL